MTACIRHACFIHILFVLNLKCVSNLVVNHYVEIEKKKTRFFVLPIFDGVIIDGHPIC